jgi:broad specificity phosphatase PhoE
MADFLRETVASHDSGAVIAVSHGGPIRILEMGLLGQPFNDHGYRSQSVPDCGTGLIVRYENGEFTAERLT